MLEALSRVLESRVALMAQMIEAVLVRVHLPLPVTLTLLLPLPLPLPLP